MLNSSNLLFLYLKSHLRPPCNNLVTRLTFLPLPVRMAHQVVDLQNIHQVVDLHNIHQVVDLHNIHLQIGFS